MKTLTDTIKEDLIKESSGKLFNKTGNADLSKTYIICDSARSKWGKSGTLRELINVLSSVDPSNLSYSRIRIYKTSRAIDRYAFFIIDDVKIFIGTAGDYDSIVKHNLNLAFNWSTGDNTEGIYMPNVVIIAARTGGKPIRTIKTVAKSHQCDVIWFKNFHDEWISPTIRKEMNSTTVESIISLIEKLF